FCKTENSLRNYFAKLLRGPLFTVIPRFFACRLYLFRTRSLAADPCFASQASTQASCVGCAIFESFSTWSSIMALVILCGAGLARPPRRFSNSSFGIVGFAWRWLAERRGRRLAEIP